MGTEQFLRLPAVVQRTGYSKSRIYALAKKGEFPAPVAIGQRATAWLESEVNNWMQARIAASRGSV